MRRRRHPQPAKAYAALADRTNRSLALSIGVSENYVGQVLNGLVPPSPRMRDALSAELGVPPEVLFRDDGVEAVAL